MPRHPSFLLKNKNKATIFYNSPSLSLSLSLPLSRSLFISLSLSLSLYPFLSLSPLFLTISLPPSFSHSLSPSLPLSLSLLISPSLSLSLSLSLTGLREREQKVWACSHRKCGYALTVPHSVRMRDYYINFSNYSYINLIIQRAGIFVMFELS